MAWSYNAGNLSSSSLFRVRFTIGDTIESDPLLQDEEIQFALDSKIDETAAAIVCCETLAARFARQVDKDLGPLSLSAHQKFTQYTELAKKLKHEASQLGAPYFVAPGKNIFDVGMMQIIGAEGADS